MARPWHPLLCQLHFHRTWRLRKKRETLVAKVNPRHGKKAAQKRERRPLTKAQFRVVRSDPGERVYRPIGGILGARIAPGGKETVHNRWHASSPVAASRACREAGALDPLPQQVWNVSMPFASGPQLPKLRLQVLPRAGGQTSHLIQK